MSIFVDGTTPLNKATLDQLEVAARKGNANGYASLDATGKVPPAQLPAAAGTDLSYDGDYVPATNYKDGDIVVSNGIAYICVTPTNTVPTVWPSSYAPPVTPGLTKLWDSVEAGVVLPAAAINTPALPQTYKSLRIVLAIRGSIAAAFDSVAFRFNGDAGVNQYDYVWYSTNAVNLSFGSIGFLLGSTATAGAAAPTVLTIPGYASPSLEKQVVGSSALLAQDGNNGTMASYTVGTKWKSLAPISTIAILPASGGNLVDPSRVTVYGEN